jgi:hypothetical protein
MSVKIMTAAFDAEKTNKRECRGCHKIRRTHNIDEVYVCRKCKSFERYRFKKESSMWNSKQKKKRLYKKKCRFCGYDGVAIEEHHVYGRNDKKKIVVCCNCHRELHLGAKPFNLHIPKPTQKWVGGKIVFGLPEVK